jgi:hypothetical protein
MQVDGVNAVSVTSGAGRPGAVNSENVNASTAVGDSTNPNNNLVDTENKSEDQGAIAPSESPKPLKSMSTSDFLSLHNNAINSDDNVMNKMMKLLEAVLALKLLDETLEAAQGDKKGDSFKEIA